MTSEGRQNTGTCLQCVWQRAKLTFKWLLKYFQLPPSQVRCKTCVIFMISRNTAQKGMPNMFPRFLIFNGVLLWIVWSVGRVWYECLGASDGGKWTLIIALLDFEDFDIDYEGYCKILHFRDTHSQNPLTFDVCCRYKCKPPVVPLNK